MTTKKLVPFTWQDFDNAVEVLLPNLRRVVEEKHITALTGLPRGGLPLAVSLSHRLKLPFDSFTGLTIYNLKHTLVVDDISDSGRSLLPYREAGCIATIHRLEGTQVEPHFYVHDKQPEDWIVYPWETPDDYYKTVQDYALREELVHEIYP